MSPSAPSFFWISRPMCRRWVSQRGHGLEPGQVTEGPLGEDGLEDPVELHERLFIEADVIDLVDGDARFAEAVIDGALGKSAVVFLAVETLFFSRGDELSVADEGGAGVVVVTGYAEYVHNRDSNLCKNAPRFTSAMRAAPSPLTLRVKGGRPRF
jgi:hypothetical protein